MGESARGTGRRPRLAYYGDDFTGSTDTLAAAVQGGWRAALFMDVPNAEDLRRHGELDCIGVAGSARAMAPEDMERVLPPIYAGLAATGAAVLHYKTCSTFDSAPHIGSIGHAVRLARAALGPATAYIVGGQPNLGRYCAYANLYARAGQDGAIHRIDRHPTMSRHPVTPMDEADLRVHLGRQGLPTVSFDAEMLELPAARQDARLDGLLQAGAEAVLFDVMRPAHLAAIGRLLWARCPADGPLLAVGPTAVVQALLAARGVPDGLKRAEEAVEAVDGVEAADGEEAVDGEGRGGGEGPERTQRTERAGPAIARAQQCVQQTFVIAGSRSPVTAVQIQQAERDGFISIAVDPAVLAEVGGDGGRSVGNPDHSVATDGPVAALAARVVAALREGRSVVAHTTFADDTPAARPGFTRALAIGSGRLMVEVLRRHPLARVGFAGGDTSSLAVQSWGITALTLAYVLAPGVAVCRIDAPGQFLDGVELMLKGGQMGPPTLFSDLLKGGADRSPV